MLQSLYVFVGEYRSMRPFYLHVYLQCVFHVLDG